MQQAVLEVNPYWLERLGSSAEELLDLIASYGLECFRLNAYGAARPTDRRAIMASCARQGIATVVVRPGAA